jgi:hypothetical protein
MKIGDEELSEENVLDRFKLLDYYREFANQIDDYFEYRNESDGDRKFVNDAFAKMMFKIRSRFEDKYSIKSE